MRNEDRHPESAIAENARAASGSSREAGVGVRSRELSLAARRAEDPGLGAGVKRGPLARAFTLIELMVTMAVIILVTAIATPSVLQIMQSHRQIRAQNLFRGLLTRARAYAIANRVSAGYRFQGRPRDSGNGQVYANDQRTYAILVYHDQDLQERHRADVDDIDIASGRNPDGTPRNPLPVSRDQTGGDPRRATTALALYAVADTAPVAFPAGIDFIQRNFDVIDNPYGVADNGDLGDQPDGNGIREVDNARTFTVLFDATGQLVQRYHVVLRRSDADVDEDGFDSIFNLGYIGTYFFGGPYDNGNSPVLLRQDEAEGGNLVIAELTENGVIRLQSEDFNDVPAGVRYTEYVARQPLWVINPYNGSMIELPGALQE